MTVPVTSTPDEATGVSRPDDLSQRPRRVERWRWLGAAAIASGLAATGLHSLLGAWLVLFLIVGFHEAGHALAARRLEVPASAMVIGVGPRIARIFWRGLRVEVRTIPLVGWVEMGRHEGSSGSLRVAAVYAAGPLASLLLSLVAVLGAMAWLQGPTNVGAADARYAAQVTSESAQAMWVAPFAPVLGLLDRTLVGPEDSDADDGKGEFAGGTANRVDDHEFVSIVAITATAQDSVGIYGIAWILMVMAGISASVAGFNLLPAWGLDGHGILHEVASCLELRNARSGRYLRRCVTTIAVVTALLGLWLVGSVLLRDILDLF